MKLTLSESVEILPGLGPKRATALANIGIKNLGELLYYFPRRYIDRSITANVLLSEGETVTLFVTILDFHLVHGKTSRLIIGTKTESNHRISLVFFKGISYFKNVFKPGMNLIVTGELKYFRGMQIMHPDFEILNTAEDPEEAQLIHTGRIIPLYPGSDALKKEGLDSRAFRRFNKKILDLLEQGKLEIPEILPEEALKKRNIPGIHQAFKEIHFPESEETLQNAKNRFIYEEFFFFNLLLNYKRKKREEIERELWPLPESPSAIRVEKNLPFKLTDSQKTCIAKIKQLNSKDTPMAALLQGDVGSGKTVTALLIALHYIDNDIQVCILAPTEILARQHFHTIQSLLSFSPFIGLELFLGKEKVKAKREKLARFKQGETRLVIGTHSLLQEDVEFKNLGLVIIDEQHKFGVEQRETLRAKGRNPDILAMTATPIPRTLSLTLYGDLELVVLKEKPAGRAGIETKWFFEDKREAVYKSIKKYLNMGRQCYIVYPLVEESEKLDLKSCIDDYEHLSRFEFKEYSLGLLHGKMKNEEKDAVMTGFKKKEIQILVTTTVVEVGIDVPNATILVIEHAERFGISQLHQLRGRVGRGEHDSFCILMSSGHISEEGKTRLSALVETTDGFELAESDLKLRGPGEILGIRQSGLPDFKLANLQKDEFWLKVAREDSEKFGNIGALEKNEISNRFSEGRILFPN